MFSPSGHVLKLSLLALLPISLPSATLVGQETEIWSGGR